MKMNPTVFQKLSQQYFGVELAKYGFQSVPKKGRAYIYGCPYYRVNEEQIYHFIDPQLSMYGRWFDVMVFANSPLINKEFHQYFATGIDVPSDNNAYFSDTSGVGWRQVTYRCRNEEDFVASFENRVMPALEKYGLPYLDRIRTLKDLVKTIHPHAVKNYEIPTELLHKEGVIKKLRGWFKN